MVLYLLIASGIITPTVLHKLYLPGASGSVWRALKAGPFLVFATLVIALAFNADAQDSPASRPLVEVGILEEVYFGDAFPGSPRLDEEDYIRRIVRVAFFWQSGRWQSYQETFRQAAEDDLSCFAFWKERHWYLRTTNEQYNELISRGEVRVPISEYFAGQCVVSAPAETKDRSNEFAGWFYHPVRPPEVLCTRQPFPDTDGWSERKSVEFFDLPENVLTVLEKYMKDEVLKKAPAPAEVDMSSIEKLVDSVSCIRSERRYSVYQVSITSDEANLSLIDPAKLAFDNAICICAGPEEGGEAWLLGDGLRLFFIGDLNRNGESELVFWIDRYNTNGYLLANSNLRAAATYEWSYH